MEKYKIIYEPLTDEDDQLLSRYEIIQKTVKDNKKNYKNLLKTCYEKNYQNVFFAKLAYLFSKEEKDMLYHELLKRGLITINS